MDARESQSDVEEVIYLVTRQCSHLHLVLKDDVPLLVNPVGNQGNCTNLKAKRIGCRGSLFITVIISLLVIGIVIAVVLIFVQSSDNNSSSSSTSQCMSKQCTYVNNAYQNSSQLKHTLFFATNTQNKYTGPMKKHVYKCILLFLPLAQGVILILFGWNYILKTLHFLLILK